MRYDSKSVSKSSHLNQYLHHANPHDKLSTSFTRMAKSWVSKYMLANPSGSKTRICLSPCVLGTGMRVENMSSKGLDLLLEVMKT